MTNFTMKRVMAVAAVLVAVTTPSTDAYVARGTRCFRQSKCVEFKVSSCSTNGQREVCIWWQKNRGCDKFWSQPFPDVCTYTLRRISARHSSQISGRPSVSLHETSCVRFVGTAAPTLISTLASPGGAILVPAGTPPRIADLQSRKSVSGKYVCQSVTPDLQLLCRLLRQLLLCRVHRPRELSSRTRALKLNVTRHAAGFLC
jgi:hypothetical protein